MNCFCLDFHREVMLEKQLTGHRVDRSICAWFWEHALSQADSSKVPLQTFIICFIFLFLLMQI